MDPLGLILACFPFDVQNLLTNLGQPATINDSRSADIPCHSIQGMDTYELTICIYTPNKKSSISKYIKYTKYIQYITIYQVYIYIYVKYINVYQVYHLYQDISSSFIAPKEWKKVHFKAAPTGNRGSASRRMSGLIQDRSAEEAGRKKSSSLKLTLGPLEVEFCSI